MKETNNNDTVAWYRQFWPWFIFGLPATVVVASLITVYIAIHHQDPVIDDDYYKNGMKINERLKTPNNAPPAKLNTPSSNSPIPQ